MALDVDTLSELYADRLTRRQFVSASAAAVLLFNSRAIAQTPEDYTVLVPHINDALSIRDGALEADLTEKSILRFLERDFLSRRNLFTACSEAEILQDYEDARSYVNTIPDLVGQGFDPEYFDFATRMSQETVIGLAQETSLPVVPVRRSVQPMLVASVAPSVEREDETDINPDLVVAFDILLQTLGITMQDSLIRSALQNEPELRAALDRLLSKVSTGEWYEVADIIENLLRLFIGADFWRRLSGIGLRKLTFRLTLRAVPVVGWAYTVAALVVSLKSNYYRFSFA